MCASVRNYKSKLRRISPRNTMAMNVPSSYTSLGLEQQLACTAMAGGDRQRKGGAICKICGGTRAQMFGDWRVTILRKERGRKYPCPPVVLQVANIEKTETTLVESAGVFSVDFPNLSELQGDRIAI